MLMLIYQTAPRDFLLGCRTLALSLVSDNALVSHQVQVNFMLTLQKQALKKKHVFFLHVVLAFLTLGPSLGQGPAHPPPALLFPFLLDADV